MDAPQRKGGRKKTISLFSLIVAVMAGLYFPLASFQGWVPFSRSPELRLEDAFVDDGPGRFPVLDVKLLNVGTQTAVLRQAHFTVDGIWKLMPSSHMTFRGLPRSATYEVTLQLRDRETAATSRRISHSLPPDHPDRFAFELKHDAPAQLNSPDYVVQMTVTLTYSGDKSLVIPDLLYVARKPGIQGSYSSASSETRRTAQELREMEGQKSEGLRSLLAEIRNAPSGAPPWTIPFPDQPSEAEAEVLHTPR